MSSIGPLGPFRSSDVIARIFDKAKTLIRKTFEHRHEKTYAWGFQVAIKASRILANSEQKGEEAFYVSSEQQRCRSSCADTQLYYFFTDRICKHQISHDAAAAPI